MAEKTPISASEATALVDKGALLIDVRSLEGRTASGEFADATVVAKTDVAGFAETVPTDAEIVVFCGTTAGSGPVVDWLDEHGYTNVQHVDGGYAALAEERAAR